jgi:hypothetical protein
MLIWIEREDAQKKAAGAVVKAPAAQAPCGATLGGRAHYRPAATPCNQAFSDPPSPDAKAFATLAAKFALIGSELRVITKASRSYFEVRRGERAWIVSTLHDVASIAARMQSVHTTEIA